MVKKSYTIDMIHEMLETWERIKAPPNTRRYAFPVLDPYLPLETGPADTPAYETDVIEMDKAVIMGKPYYVGACDKRKIIVYSEIIEP